MLGHCIVRVTVFDAKAIRQPTVEEFCHQLAGRAIVSLTRRGKYLIFSLSAPRASRSNPTVTGEASFGQPRSPATVGTLAEAAASSKSTLNLIAHLKLSGALLLNAREPPKYSKVLLQLDNGSQLLFTDPRRFARMWLVEDIRTVTGKLGPEPLSADFTPQVLADRLRGRKAPIKAVLLDQNVIAGIGNMYADESLFAARIHPLQKAGDLSPGKTRKLHAAIHEVLTAAIGDKGASIRNYIRPGGERGTAHFGFSVAHRGGEPCPNCRRPIQRMVVRNRGTYFCPHCQRLRPATGSYGEPPPFALVGAMP